MLEKNILKGLLDRNNYLNYRNYLKQADFTREAYSIVRVIDTYYSEHTESLSLAVLTNLFFSQNFKDSDYYKGVFNALEELKDDTSFGDLLRSFKTKRLCEDISVLAYEVVEGKKTVKDLHTVIDRLDSPVDESKFDFVTMDPDALFKESYEQPGLNWRLKCLRKSLGPLRRGDFGIIFARPETGKTTFLASETSYMLDQLKPEDGPIIWFNNEEQGAKVQVRVIQAYFAVTTKELNEKRNLINEFSAKFGEKFRLLDDTKGTLDKYLVEAVCEKYSPSLVLFDQIDKVGGFSSDREDLRLGQIYIWARGLAKRYCPVIGVCQADGSGEGEEFLTMANLSNSKTSKAAEADWICGIGASHESGKHNIRGISIPKNKLLGDKETDETWRHKPSTVLIRSAIQRYIDTD